MPNPDTATYDDVMIAYSETYVAWDDCKTALGTITLIIEKE